MRLPLFTLIVAPCALFLSGCANFAEQYRQGARNLDARAHRGTGFKPTYDSQGYYTGYTQKVGPDTYYHAPDGRVISVHRNSEAPKWVDHYDEQGRLIKKTLDGALKASLTYHYSRDGMLRSITSWSRMPDGQVKINGYKQPPFTEDPYPLPSLKPPADD